IPPLLEGRDVLGQAQTGTGKTAAFALPILSRLNLRKKKPQALVLAPTRELAIQVAEAFQRYAAGIKGFHVLPIYGGQSYGPQLAALRRGVHVVVGTPGRVMDHIKRGTLTLDGLDWLVLDEADEMLRMGFIDDVEWIFDHTPPERQVALFSATMPSAVRRIAKTHLRDAAEITIKARTSTVTNTRQRYWLVSGLHKLDALTRLLEVESFDAMLVFARTKKSTEELAERLEARGFACAALNGDMQQAQRERTVARLKAGKLDILIATDVAARGLDVERISHVVNFDIPYDTESYVHRIGRTGRAGRSGEAILFVTPRERRMLGAIERATRQPIEPMQPPSVEAVNDQRVARFKQRISDRLAADDLDEFKTLVAQYERDHEVSAIDIAAALASLTQGDTPLLLEPGKADRAPRFEPESGPRKKSARKSRAADADMETYRVEVGHAHGVQPGNIVGAIANEAGLDSQYIGRIDIRDDHSFVDLPQGMPKETFNELKKVWVVNQQLRISRADDELRPMRKRPPKPKLKKSPKKRKKSRT
ncbi:MAG TPA: DEAD/DEAH box helicase, partial [Gammaproteobacteria bacterium]|nr:DEAD/DEAH box helicase [Gammaproteobacteria bacterium]